MELISVRIPKTGSSTLNHYLECAYGVQPVVLPQIKEAWRSDSPLYHNRLESQEIIRSYAKLLHEHEFVHLHLPVWAWEGLFPEAFRVCFMRDPLTWVISCFFFAKALGHIPYEMGIWHYLEIPHRKNWQSWYMGNQVRNFDFIGFQETFEEDVRQLFSILGRPITWESATLNQSVDPIFLSVKKYLLRDRMFRRRVKTILRQDYRIYKEAWRRFKGATPLPNI